MTDTQSLIVREPYLSGRLHAIAVVIDQQSAFVRALVHKDTPSSVKLAKLDVEVVVVELVVVVVVAVAFAVHWHVNNNRALSLHLSSKITQCHQSELQSLIYSFAKNEKGHQKVTNERYQPANHPSSQPTNSSGDTNHIAYYNQLPL